MKQLTPVDLAELSQQDKRLMFNYFGALDGAQSRQRQTLITAVLGCTLIAMAYGLDFAGPDDHHLPGWYPVIQWLAKVLPALFTPVLVAYQLWEAKTLRSNALALASALKARGLDPSNLSEDDIYFHLVLPMLREAGLPIEEESKSRKRP
ncbi:hypothetical protein [Acidovorax delafieldii]|uniref:hypothetical protein n=1 Tax=Acidovorax delafieldii TaxID=47920 RepID=UPI003ECD156F